MKFLKSILLPIIMFLWTSHNHAAQRNYPEIHEMFFLDGQPAASGNTHSLSISTISSNPRHPQASLSNAIKQTPAYGQAVQNFIEASRRDGIQLSPNDVDLAGICEQNGRKIVCIELTPQATARIAQQREQYAQASAEQARTATTKRLAAERIARQEQAERDAEAKAKALEEQNKRNLKAQQKEREERARQEVERTKAQREATLAARREMFAHRPHGPLPKQPPAAALATKKPASVPRTHVRSHVNNSNNSSGKQVSSVALKSSDVTAEKTETKPTLLEKCASEVVQEVGAAVSDCVGHAIAHCFFPSPARSDPQLQAIVNSIPTESSHIQQEEATQWRSDLDQRRLDAHNAAVEELKKRVREEPTHQPASDRNVKASRKEHHRTAGTNPIPVRTRLQKLQDRQASLIATQQNTPIIIDRIELPLSVSEHNPYCGDFRAKNPKTPFEQQLHMDLCATMIDADRVRRDNPHHPFIPSLSSTADHFAAFANVCHDPELAWSLADTSEAYVKTAHVSEKIYNVFKQGIIPGACDNIQHDVDVLTHLVHDPANALYQELVQTRLDAAKTLGKALFRAASLMPLSDDSPEVVEEKTRFIAESLSNLANHVYENPYQAIRAVTNLIIEFAKPHGNAIGYLAARVKDAARITKKFARSERALKEFARTRAMTGEIKAAVHLEEGITREAGKFAHSKHIDNVARSTEIILPKFDTFEQARNKALELVGDLGHDSVPWIGGLEKSAGFNKIIGRQSANKKLGWRLDWDKHKGSHINVVDFTAGKGNLAVKYCIQFNGNEELFKSLLKHLNK